MGLPDAGKRREATLAAYSGAIGSFRYLGELSEDEEHDWRDRMLVALGITPPEPARQGVSQFIHVGNPDPGTARTEPPDVSRFVRSVLGPDAEFERHGGRLRVLAVDIYDTVVTVRWRVAPEPDIFSAFPAEAIQLAQDVEGADAWAAEHLREKAEQRLRMMRLYRFSLTDDTGTKYMTTGGSHGGGNNEMTGEAKFLPAPPPTAATLTFTWLDQAVRIPLA